ncbi:MAG: FAD-dependent oxidoreductase, partial [Clostridiales bacterium]|nr:FAD-dependent oxidoreductase [Clostridiales bacterium]
MKERYDVAIIGGGIGGLMTAYRLLEKNHGISLCILEKGPPISKRVCPILAKKTDSCVSCPACSIMEGMAGAGAFSDGKYVIST